MELKDVILSTLAEMEDGNDLSPVAKESEIENQPQEEQFFRPTEQEDSIVESKNDNELLYLNSIRERLLVLFEGFQAPNNTNIEAKVDMTLNFLEYMLATIDSRVHKLEKGE
jgi:hypothetical protein